MRRETERNYIHTNLHELPDFGVPYYRPGRPASASSVYQHCGRAYRFR
jgi:hypothetical protein